MIKKFVQKIAKKVTKPDTSNGPFDQFASRIGMSAVRPPKKKKSRMSDSGRMKY